MFLLSNTSAFSVQHAGANSSGKKEKRLSVRIRNGGISFAEDQNIGPRRRATTLFSGVFPDSTEFISNQEAWVPQHVGVNSGANDGKSHVRAVSVTSNMGYVPRDSLMYW